MLLVLDLWLWHHLRGVAGDIVVQVTFVVDVCDGLTTTSADLSWAAFLDLQRADAHTIVDKQLLAEGSCSTSVSVMEYALEQLNS